MYSVYTYTSTRHRFGITHNILVQTHIHEVSAPWCIFSRKITRGEKGQPQQFLVRAIFSFSRPSHLGVLVLRLFCVLKFPILEDKTIFLNLATLGHKL